ncbi:MAG: hypothetical protein HFJ59_04070 [Clostridia bacterium]|nr:hypothetical protein [Clostridia bacterium]
MAEIDISTKLGKEKATIKIAPGKVYEVDTSADNYLLVQEKLKDKDFSIETMYEMIEMLMGEKALEEIKEMKLTIPGLQAVVIALSATVNEISYEEMEKRFPKD